MLPKLQNKHAVWIIDAALESFLEKIKDTESELVRHKALFNVPLATKRGLVATRSERCEYLESFRAQYMNIAEVLAEMRTKAVDASAEEFARQFKANFAP